MGLRKTVFGRQKLKPNTFIGGVASYIFSREAVASLFFDYPSLGGVNVNRIKAFKIVGNDIEFHIEGTYGIRSYSNFSSNTNTITYYDDSVNLLKQIGTTGNPSFGTQSFCKYLNIKGVINWYSGQDKFTGYSSRILDLPNLESFFNSASVQLPINKIWYLPKCVRMGNAALRDSIYTNTYSVGTRFYVSQTLQTINAGGVETDLSTAIASGCVVRYVLNFTSPSGITNLSAGTKTSSTIQLNFTTPGSSNGIDFYEVFINGVYHQRILASGDYISSLSSNTNYQISIQAVDIYYNKSINSNSINIKTL